MPDFSATSDSVHTLLPRKVSVDLQELRLQNGVLTESMSIWTAQLEKFQQAYPDAFKANVKMPPAGHYGNVETEIGRACVQLASPDFKYMSGETITLEGGMGLRP